jgi:hypothetical protein
MKKILFVLFILSSLSAYAGDMYLVCEDGKNDDFRSVSINKGRARMVLNLSDRPLILDVTQFRRNKISRYNVKVSHGHFHHQEKRRLKLFEEIKVGSYICLIRD